MLASKNNVEQGYCKAGVFMVHLTFAFVAFTLLAHTFAAFSQTSCIPTPTPAAPASSLTASPTPNALQTAVATSAKAITARIQAQSLTLVPPPVIEVFGHSAQGKPLIAYSLGNGPNVTLICGAFHGNEAGSAVVVAQLLGYLRQHPEQLIGCRVVLVPQVNPDGLAAGQRANARGVDLNRNFPGNWQRQPFRARYHPGPQPASEPETQAFMRLIKRYGPTKVISIHSPFHTMNWTGERSHALARVMQQFNKYPVTDNIGYPTPGSLGNYCGRVLRIAIITLELPREAASRSWANNRDALLAAIRYCA